MLPDETRALLYSSGGGRLGPVCRREPHCFDFQLKGLKQLNYAGFEALWLNSGLTPCLRSCPLPSMLIPNSRFFLALFYFISFLTADINSILTERTVCFLTVIFDGNP